MTSPAGAAMPPSESPMSSTPSLLDGLMTSALGASLGLSSLPRQTASTSTEFANAHDAGDCSVHCEHPDHAFDGPVDLDWLMASDGLLPEWCEQVDRYDGGPVIL